jgi:hypothetical protein
MVQVSMVAYATAGAFLGLGYFDLYYTLIVMVIAARRILDAELAALDTKAKSAGGRVRQTPRPAQPPALAHRR